MQVLALSPQRDSSATLRLSWRALLSQTDGVEILAIEEMTCTPQAWADWLECDNGYARGDRAAIEAGALDYLNSLAIVMRKL